MTFKSQKTRNVKYSSTCKQKLKNNQERKIKSYLPKLGQTDAKGCLGFVGVGKSIQTFYDVLECKTGFILELVKQRFDACTHLLTIWANMGMNGWKWVGFGFLVWGLVGFWFLGGGWIWYWVKQRGLKFHCLMKVVVNHSLDFLIRRKERLKGLGLRMW